MALQQANAFVFSPCVLLADMGNLIMIGRKEFSHLPAKDVLLQLYFIPQKN